MLSIFLISCPSSHEACIMTSFGTSDLENVAAYLLYSSYSNEQSSSFINDSRDISLFYLNNFVLYLLKKLYAKASPATYLLSTLVVCGIEIAIGFSWLSLN